MRTSGAPGGMGGLCCAVGWPLTPWLCLILPEEKAWLVLLAESSPGLSAWLQNSIQSSSF